MAVWAGNSPPAPNAAASAPSAVQDSADKIMVNPFAKFGAISDATPLWRSAAEQLSTYAAEVRIERTYSTLDAVVTCYLLGKPTSCYSHFM